MATITVTAKDTASAMEDVFEQLGDDAYIIETTKKWQSFYACYQ